MFELLLIACVGFTGCETLKSPLLYPSAERCAQQAALLAGRTKGRHSGEATLVYEFRCADSGRQPELAGQWVRVMPAEPVALVKIAK